MPRLEDGDGFFFSLVGLGVWVGPICISFGRFLAFLHSLALIRSVQYYLIRLSGMAIGYGA